MADNNVRRPQLYMPQNQCKLLFSLDMDVEKEIPRMESTCHVCFWHSLSLQC